MARSNPDLNFNKGVAPLYEVDYPAAAASVRKDSTSKARLNLTSGNRGNR